MASLDGILHNWMQTDPSFQELLLSDFGTEDSKIIFDRLREKNPSPLGKDLIARVKAHHPSLKFDSPEVPVAIFLDTLVTEKTRKLEKYVDSFSYDGMRPIATQPVKRYITLIHLLKDIYASHIKDNYIDILLDVPEDLEREHYRAAYMFFEEKLKEGKGKLDLRILKRMDESNAEEAWSLILVILAAIKKYPGPQLKITLQNFGINSEGVSDILKNLPADKISYLDLSNNQLDNKAVGPLCTFANDPSEMLDVLALNSNRIDTVGALGLAPFYKSHRPVRLELRNNPHVDEIAKDLNKIAREEGHSLSSVET